MKYETYNRYILRKPLYSYDILFNNRETKNIEDVVDSLIQDDTFITSIYWSSPDLYQTIIQYRENTLKPDRIPKLIHTLKKYAIRSSTRCTPYGTMAGIALKHLGKDDPEETAPPSRKTRIDMDFLREFKSHIENNEKIRKNLKYKVNNTLFKASGQYRYQEFTNHNGEEKCQMVSLDFNEYLERISGFSQYTSYDDIKKLLLPDFSHDEISDFLEELIDIQFLVSEIQLTLTEDTLQNIKNVVQRLLKNDIAEAEIYLYILNKIEHCIALLDHSALNILPVSEINELKSAVKELEIEKTHFFHVDLNHSPEGKIELDEKTRRNIYTSVAILHKFGSANPLNKDLKTFKSTFTTRYESREVPLMEVLDSEFGIGFPAASKIGSLHVNPLIEGLSAKNKDDKRAARSSNTDLILDLIEKGENQTVHLEHSDLGIIEENPVSHQNFSIIGTPARENFFLQSVGNSGANSILGRLSLFNPEIETLCRDIHHNEQEKNPDIILAEVIYIPEKRVANIARRPKFSAYEIPIFAGSSSEDTHQILLSDLLISIEKDEIILRSRKLNKRVIPRLSNAHNFHKSENIYYKFLCALQSQGQDNIHLDISYSKTKKRFVPRIVYKNIILHRASWLLHESDIILIKNASDPLAELKKFFKKWSVAQYVVLVQGDNELFLDTSNDTYLSLLIDELKNNKMLQLAEWLLPVDGEKNYNHQIILPLENKNFKKPVSSFRRESSSIQRSFAPGSEWLYLKIYCSSALSDHILAEVLKPILDGLIKDNIIKSSFFILYTDPHYHIRFRVNLINTGLYSEVLQRIYTVLNPYLQQETIWNLQIDSYHREIERYFPEYMEATETAFHYDSLLVLSLLSHDHFTQFEDIRLFASVKNVDHWLSLFNFSLQEKLDFCKSMESVFLQEFSAELKSHINLKYRILKEDLHSFLTSSHFEEEFTIRNKNLRNLKLCRENLSSYIHMSVNRWFSSEQRALELMTYSFASRYYSRILSQTR